MTLLSKEKGKGTWYTPENDEDSVDENFYYFDIEEYGIKKELWDIFYPLKVWMDFIFFTSYPNAPVSSDGIFSPRFRKGVNLFYEERLIDSSKIYERYAFHAYFGIDLKQSQKENDITEESSKEVYLINCEAISDNDN